MDLQNQKTLPGNLAERIFAAMHEGILILDASNHILMVNKAAVEQFGLENEGQLVGRHIRDIYANSAKADQAILDIQKNEISGQEETFTGANGSTFQGSFTFFAINESQSSEVFKVFILRDITDEKDSEKKLTRYTQLLEKNNKELDQFSYIVSHDLKAPLRAITNLASWLEEDLEGTLSDENKTNLELLRSRASRMEALINGVLDYSRIGRIEMPSEQIDVFEMINDVIELLAPPSNVKITISESMPFLMAPRTMLHQVFSNLIGNAIKYNDKKEGLITISAIDKGNSFEFTVEDNGPGIPQEHHDKIFMIFQTLQARDKIESTGVGLTIVKRILEDRGGDIRIESKEGVGSKFIFNWPKENSDKTE